MINVGYFDRKFLRETREKGIRILQDGTLTSDELKVVKEDVEMYTRFLAGNFNLVKEPSMSFADIETLKSYVLLTMVKHYKLLGVDLLKWVINLNNEAIFENREKSYDFSDISTYEQAEDTLRLYRKYNRKFYDQAMEIYSYKSTCQVQEDYGLTSSSYCTFCSITNLPLIIVNPGKTPTVVNHETQHGVEYMLGFNTHELYKELGSITFELLSLDQLFKKRGFLYPTDYYTRINDMANSLSYLGKYFELLLDFSKDEFDIPTDIFIEKACSKFGQEQDTIHEYLEKKLAVNLIGDDLEYLFSYLKAIELRWEMLINKENGMQLLDSFLRSSTFTFVPPQNGVKVYEKYIRELDKKARIW